ncbi:MAG: hypothetical protein RLY98_1476 [Bacteroidota bacterium]|jgi:hypothetical protein
MEIDSNSTIVLNQPEIAKIIYDHFKKTHVVSHKLFVKDILVLCDAFNLSGVQDEYYEEAIGILKKFLWDTSNFTYQQKLNEIPNLVFALTIIVFNSYEIKSNDSFLNEMSTICEEYWDVWLIDNNNLSA